MVTPLLYLIAVEEKLKQLIETSDNILVTSHISPDIDAVCSSLLMVNTLNKNFPDKAVNLVLEEMPSQEISFLSGYENIKFQNLAAFVKDGQTDLIVMVDADKFSRCSRLEGDVISEVTKERNIKSAAIDHHELMGEPEVDVYINNGSPAAAQEVYSLLYDKLNLQKPEGYGNATMLGLLSDTLRFKYKNSKHRQTFALVSNLIDSGVDIEKLENKLEAYSKLQLQVVAHIINNLSAGEDYNYSFISDSFLDEWMASAKDKQEIKNGSSMFVNQLVRNIQPNNWGFLVYREPILADSTYKVSLRAESGSKDVSKLAQALGGGGHKSAAGAKFHAESVEDAVTKVLSAVENESVS